MDALVSLVDEVGTIDERYIEPYYISYDRAETGYHEFPDDEALISLLQNLPIGGLGNRYTADLFDPGTKARWGRTVAARFATSSTACAPAVSNRWEDAGACAR